MNKGMKENSLVRVTDKSHPKFGKEGRVVTTHTYPEAQEKVFLSVRFQDGEFGVWVEVSQVEKL